MATCAVGPMLWSFPCPRYYVRPRLAGKSTRTLQLFSEWMTSIVGFQCERANSRRGRRSSYYSGGLTMPALEITESIWRNAFLGVVWTIHCDSVIIPRSLSSQKATPLWGNIKLECDKIHGYKVCKNPRWDAYNEANRGLLQIIPNSGKLKGTSMLSVLLIEHRRLMKTMKGHLDSPLNCRNHSYRFFHFLINQNKWWSMTKWW